MFRSATLFFNRYSNSLLGSGALIMSILLLFKYVWHSNDSDKCLALLKYGRWSSSPSSKYLHWDPRGCMMHSFDSKDIRKCLSTQKLTIIGDSRAREIVQSIVMRMGKDDVQRFNSNTLDLNMTMLVDDSLRFIWNPFLNSTAINEGYMTQIMNENHTFVIEGGLSQGRNLHDQYRIDFPRSVSNAIRILSTTDPIPSQASYTISAQVDIILNVICNSLPGFERHPATCCKQYPQFNLVQYVICASAVLTFMVSWTRVFLSSTNPNDLTMSKAAAALSTVLLYCQLADRSSVFEKAAKLVDQNMFLLVSGVTLSLGLVSVRPCKAGQWLPRSQTEEWKGWMQLIILLYHYFGMSRVLWVYQVVRVLVGAYLFMTGYGHTSYFIRSNDFSVRRGMAVLVRLNMLTILVAYAMDNRYSFYYFPILSSFWFLVTWATIGRNRTNLIGHSIRILMSTFLVITILNTKGPLEFIFKILRQFYLMNVDLHEFKFRILLDCYVPFIGMFAAVLQRHLQELDLYNTASYTNSNKRATRCCQILMFPLSSAILICYFTLSSRFSSKQEYNKWHPIISPVPILAFVALRNSTHRLRVHYSRFFAWIGQCSLETFILQYHIWLAIDTKGLLRLGLFDHAYGIGDTTISSRGFWIESIIITAYFLWASSMVSRASATLTAYLIQREDGSLFENNSCGTSDQAARKIVRRFKHCLLNFKLGIILIFLWLLSITSQS